MLSNNHNTLVFESRLRALDKKLKLGNLVVLKAETLISPNYQIQIWSFYTEMLRWEYTERL